MFGYVSMASEEMDHLRKLEQKAVFTKVLQHAKKKFDKKREEYKTGRRNPKRTMCFIDAKEMKNHAFKTKNTKQAFAAKSIFGDTKLP